MIFHVVKVSKHSWDQCCHLAVETDSWFPLNGLEVSVFLPGKYFQPSLTFVGKPTIVGQASWFFSYSPLSLLFEDEVPTL